jgi:hypothetical protein
MPTTIIFLFYFTYKEAFYKRLCAFDEKLGACLWRGAPVWDSLQQCIRFTNRLLVFDRFAPLEPVPDPGDERCC